MSNTVVLKIGGSFLLKDDKPDVDELRQMAIVVKELLESDEKRRVIVVVGGGISARNYIGAAGSLGASKGLQDHLGVLVSRLNARVFVEALCEIGIESWSDPPEDLQTVRSALNIKRVVVLGGLQPGQSTTAVAALCAEYCKAPRVIYSTNVDGVYTADPSKDKNAVKFNKVSYGKLRDLTCSGDNTLPGQYRIMDNVALTILERSSLEAVVLLGQKQNVNNKKTVRFLHHCVQILNAVSANFASITADSINCGTIVCAETVEAKQQK